MVIIRRAYVDLSESTSAEPDLSLLALIAEALQKLQGQREDASTRSLNREKLPMDPASLAATAMTVVSPYLANSAPTPPRRSPRRPASRSGIGSRGS